MIVGNLEHLGELNDFGRVGVLRNCNLALRVSPSLSISHKDFNLAWRLLLGKANARLNKIIFSIYN